MQQNEIIRIVWRDFEPLLEQAGYELVEVELTGGLAGGQVLRFFVDKPGSGVTLDDCTTVSQLLNPHMDTGDLISDRYMLEVSSPGIDRPIRKPADFERFSGEKVCIVLHAPVLGRKKYRGILQGFQDGLIQMECDGEAFDVHLENLKKAKLDR